MRRLAVELVRDVVIVERRDSGDHVVPSLAGLRRRVAGFRHPPSWSPGDWTPGHPDHPLTENARARVRFTAALEAIADGDLSSSSALEAMTARRPGLAPAGDIGALQTALTRAASVAPENLTVRMALAESLASAGEADQARDLAISVIRGCRPVSPARGTSTAAVDPTPFSGPQFHGGFFHSIDLGSGFVEGDPKTALITAREMLRLHWPDLRGRSVLDIGAYGGWFAFEAERRGAARVTANDYYAWMVDYPPMWAWVGEQQRAGVDADTYAAPYPCNDPERQPGRALFDATHAALGSRVTAVFGPVETTPLEPHDIVLLLGVLYHHESPIKLLRRAFDLTRETLIVETLGFEYTHALNAPIWHFYGAGDPLRDNTTMWAPSAIALREALLKVGFRRVDLLYGWDSFGYVEGQETLECRLWVHAHR